MISLITAAQCHSPRHEINLKRNELSRLHKYHTVKVTEQFSYTNERVENIQRATLTLSEKTNAKSSLFKCSC